MPQEDYSEMQIFNPAPSIHTQGGAPINAVFVGWKVNFPIGAMCSFPYEAGKALLDRYPWLQLVKDHPAMKDLKPLPSGVEGWNPKGFVEKKEESEATTLYTSSEPEVIPANRKTLMSLLTCPLCGKSTPTTKGMWTHKKRVHKIEDGSFPNYGHS